MKIIFSITTLCCALIVEAQTTDNHHLRTDTEIGSDNSVTQYILYDYTHEGKTIGLSSMILSLRAADGSLFLQFAAGPNFRKKCWLLNTYFGGAKGGRLIAAASVSIDLPQRFKLVAVSDPKFPVGDISRAPEIWFSRVWLGRGHLYFRHDNLQEAGHGNISSKAGMELRLSIKQRVELYTFPHNDYQKHRWGITAGLRFRLL